MEAARRAPLFATLAAAERWSCPMHDDEPIATAGSFPPGAILPDHPTYDDLRRSFNGTVDRRPAAIVPCRSTADVVAAVRAARALELPIAVRGGGHSVAGHSVADGALVVDLRGMRFVDVDAGARLARAGGGALWEDLDGATVPHGLATTGGTFVDTGIGGLTLTGGIGYLMGTGGFTCDTLVGAEVVTADGEIVRAGPDGDPELLWALRGGGGNFGVVTEFVYRLQPIGRLQSGAISFPLRQARAALAAAAELAHTAPDELCLFAVGPDMDPVDDADPATVEPRFRLAIGFQGTAAEAKAAVAPLLELPGGTLALAEVTYPEIQSRTGKLPFGLRHYWKGHFVRELDAHAIDAVVSAMETLPGGSSFLLVEAITGRARTEPAGGAAFGQREARWNVSALAIWEEPADDVAMRDWARATADAVAASSLSGAGYGNYATDDESQERIQAGFGSERMARLRAVKRRYDPGNVFRFNHNIAPD
jgi:FAD/FMN-containing dehydrogenase